MGLVSLKSNLAINGTPQRYDTNGKLKDLPDGSSNLDFDSSLPSPVDNFPNTNANGFTIKAPVGVTQFVNDGQTSKLGWTGTTPPVYDFLSGVNPSEGQEKVTSYGFPGSLPKPADWIDNTNAKGFTIQNPVGVSQFVNKGQTSQLGFTSPLPPGVDFITNNNAKGFTIQNPIGVSQFINNGQTSIYGFPGPLPKPVDFIANNNAKGFTIKAPIGVSQFIDKGQTSIYGFNSPLPAGVDFIANKNSIGFTIQNPIGVSQFINNGQTSIYGIPGSLPSGVDFIANTNANGFTIKAPIGISQFVNDGQTSIYGFTSPLPSGVDFIANTNANGFTIQNPIGISQFINNGQTSIYGFNSSLPSGVDFITNNNAKGFTIQNPIGVSQFVNGGQTSIYGFPGSLPSPVDFITNTNAKGFTIQNPIGVSQFINKGQTSQLGFTSPLPSGVDFIANTNANGFTIQNPIGVSQFINKGQTSIYGFPGALPAPVDFILNTNAGGFTIQNPIGVSQFINNGQTSVYGFPGSLPAPVDNFLNTNANGFTIQNPIGVSQFVNNGQTSIYGIPGSLPSGVDFITNKNSIGFTIQNPIGVSQFINDGQTSIYGFNSPLPSPVDNFLNTNANGFTIQNPIGVSQFINDGQTSIYGFPGSLPSPVDFILNSNAGGFTIQAPIGVTQFINDGQTSIYGFPGPLPSPVDFIANNNAKGFTIQNPIGKSQFKGINIGSLSYINPTGNNLINTNQGLGVDFIPNYDARGFTIKMFKTQFKGININSLSYINPTGNNLINTNQGLGVDFITNQDAKGFIIKNPVGKSQFKGINVNSLTYNTTSLYGNVQNNPAGGVGVDFLLNNNAGGFIIKNPIGVSQFVGVDTANGVYNNTSLYGNIQNNPALSTGVDNFFNNNANGFIIKNPVGISQFVGVDAANGVYNNTSLYGNIQNQPLLGVDFLANNHGYGFTIRMNSSNFVSGGQTSIYGFWNPLPPPVNFLGDQNATGFTIQNPVGVTQFVGADTANRTYINPTGKNLINSSMGTFGVNYLNDKPQRNFIIRQQRLASNFVGISQDYTTYNNPTGNRIGAVDFFQDGRSGATGFKPRLDPYESNFIGISTDNTKYQYPVSVKGARLLNVTLGTSGGTAKLENQLGVGSKMGNTGFYAAKRYSEVIRNDENKSFLMSWALRRHSPSPLENAYTYSTYYGHDLKLRSTAYNPTYMAHPLILRGLQNPDHLGPQRWGLTAGPKGQTVAGGLVAALDGGFIRGGASTAAERSAIDTARIAKFLASPKGLVWTITQVGLGKSNVRPYGYLPESDVTTLTGNPVPAINNTHTHLGLTSLLSVPGSAFGLHFTRHGIPFLNEAVDYSNFHRAIKQAELDKGTSFNRLTLLQKDLLNVNDPNNISLGGEITRLSKPGGPQSVYGIGNTTITRVTDTLEGWKRYKPRAYPDPIKLKELPQQPKRSLGFDVDMEPNRARKRYLDKRAAVVAENKNITEQNQQAARSTEDLNKRLKQIDLELSPWYSFDRQYAPTFNNNKTTQGTIAYDKSNAADHSANLEDWKQPGAPFGLELQLTAAAGKLDKNTLKDDSNAEPNINFIPGDGKLGNPDAIAIVANPPRSSIGFGTTNETVNGMYHSSLPYAEIRKVARDRVNGKNTTINDFRSKLEGTPDNQKTYSSDPQIANYEKNNLRDRYGFGSHGNPNADRSDPYKKKDSSGKLVGNIDDTIKKLKTDPKALANDRENFRGDRINAIDFQKKTTKDEIYADDAKDFIKFYFSDIDFFSSTGDEAIVFRASIKGLADSFQPGWSNIQVMGRPDGPALYSSFERNIAFNFTVAATSREELVPMWRKLNYLASYTMPVYGAGGKPGGVMCRMTIGDMFNNTPGFFTGLTISVNDEATWDLAEDAIVAGNTYSKINHGSKQLPNLIDVDVQFRILHDWRPQKGGRVYHLYEGNNTPKQKLINKNTKTSWLWDVQI